MVVQETVDQLWVCSGTVLVAKALGVPRAPPELRCRFVCGKHTMPYSELLQMAVRAQKVFQEGNNLHLGPELLEYPILLAHDSVYDRRVHHAAPH
jgi:hypothetical protein